jgi:SnoaL-like domain
MTLDDDDSTPLRSGKPVAVALAVILIGAALIKWWPSDTRAIRRQLDALADVLSVPPAESDISRAARLADLQSYFTPDVRLHFTERDIANRDELQALAAGWTPPPGGVFVEFANEAIALPGNNTAHVDATARISVRDQATTDTNVSERPTTFDLVNVDGDWIIAAVESRAEQPPAR